MIPKTDPRELRNLRRIAAVALLVLAAAFVWLQFHRDAPRTVVFPDGTRIQLHRVTWGAAMEGRRPGNLRSRIGQWMAGAWSVPLHPAIPLPEVVTTRSGHSFRLDPVTDGFGTRFGPTVDNVLEPGHLEIIVVQGSRMGPIMVETLDDTGVPFEAFAVRPSLPVALHRDEVRWADWRSPRLRFRVRGGGIEKTIELPNPRAPASLRNFREPAEPLPAVRTKEGVEMHLAGLRPVVHGDPESVAWVPELRFRHKGRDVTQEMVWRHLFEDADGRVHSQRLLASEPKWRIQIQATPGSLPGPGDGDPVGIRLPEVPGAGEWIPLADLGRLRSRGIVGGGFSGPGIVSVVDGVQREAGTEGPRRARITEDSWELGSREEHPVLWLVLDTRGVERPPWPEGNRDHDGWWSVYRASEDTWAESPARPVDSIVDRRRRLVRIDLPKAQAGEVRLVGRLRFNETFLVDAPRAPKADGPEPAAAPAR